MPKYKDRPMGTRKTTITQACPFPLCQLISTHIDVNSVGRQQPRRFAKPPYRPAIRVIRESSILPSALHNRCSTRESIIEPGCAWPLSKLPAHRTRTTCCAFTTSSTILRPAEALPKSSDADTRWPRSIFEPRQGPHLTYRVWVTLPALFVDFFLASRVWRMWGHIHPSTRPQASL